MRQSHLLENLPLWISMISAVLLVFVYVGVTEPFTTNGYADPLWAVAGVGAVAYGLQLDPGRREMAVSAILVAVAGETKVEGTATAAVIIVLFALRRSRTVRVSEQRSDGPAPDAKTWRITPLVIGALACCVLALWPLTMRALRVGADTNTEGARLSPIGQRVRQTYDAMVPHLDVLVLALAVAVVCGIALRGTRSLGGIGNDLWAWAVLAGGLGAVAAAYVLGPGNSPALTLWLDASVNRVTEFPALMAWWILAMWAVVASSRPIRDSGALRWPGMST